MLPSRQAAQRSSGEGRLAPLTVGVVGTVLFAIIYTIEGATRPGYNVLQRTISSLSNGPDGWMQQANFMLCGASVFLLAFAWRAILKGGAGATVYPALRVIEGVGLFGSSCLLLLHAAIDVERLGQSPDRLGSVRLALKHDVLHAKF